jgi:hypothetical protein
MLKNPPSMNTRRVTSSRRGTGFATGVSAAIARIGWVDSPSDKT